MAMSDKIAFQLFSARKFQPLIDQLSKLQAVGISDVQLFFHGEDDETPPMDFAATRARLDELGMTASSGHFDIPMFDEGLASVLDVAHRFDMNLVVLPYLPPDRRPDDAAGWRAFGRQLQAWSDDIAKDGLRFCWHNHDFEFEALSDGSFPLEHILGDRLLWEPDLAWITVGRQSPVEWLERYAGRLPAVHLKDIARPGGVIDEGGFTDLGNGILPWQTIWPAMVKSGVELAVLEHDFPKDYVRFATNSVRYLRQLMASGR